MPKSADSECGWSARRVGTGTMEKYRHGNIKGDGKTKRGGLENERFLLNSKSTYDFLLLHLKTAADQGVGDCPTISHHVDHLLKIKCLVLRYITIL